MSDDKIDTGGPAFPPHIVKEWNLAGSELNAYHGMTLRQWFAGKALQGMIASNPIADRTRVDKNLWASVAYKFADAMIAEGKKS